MIIYRYRNNLFHGEKAIASLPMQKDNFINANKFLIAGLLQKLISDDRLCEKVNL